jgi:hypothetical protein
MTFFSRSLLALAIDGLSPNRGPPPFCYLTPGNRARRRRNII